MPQFKVENLYRTTITSSSGIAASGDVNFTVTTPPINSNGYIVISPDSTTLREIMYYHNVSGNTIYVRAENRISPKAHSKNEVVQINDVAEIFNTYSDMISTCFYVEKTGGLTVKVWGGTVYYNALPQTVADTNLTLTDNTTNYIKYDFATNVISGSTVNSGNIKATIVVTAGVITSIVYNVSKESASTQGPAGADGAIGPEGPAGPAGPAGAGDVSASSTITDNAIVRGDGGVKGVQQSNILISDADTISNVNSIILDTSYTGTPVEAEMYWDSTEKTYSIKTGLDTVVLQVGREMHMLCRNNTGSTIVNGKAVYITGSSTNPTIALAQANDYAKSSKTIGITTMDIANGADGIVTIMGLVHDLNTAGFAAGDILYLDNSTTGGIINTNPTGINYSLEIGMCILSNAVTGVIAVGVKALKAFPSDEFKVTDATDKTKQMTFNVSGITAGTKRTYTMPNQDLSLVGDISTQTLTNKGISLGTNTITATKSQLNTAVTDGDIVFLDSADTISGVKTFLAGMFGLRNVANTITSFFTNTNTVSRTYTLQNRNGTLADDTDLGLKANLESPTFTGTVVLPAGQVITGAINAQTGTTYTFVLADQSKLVTFTNVSPIAVTIPTNASVAFPVGTQIDCSQDGAGKVTFSGAGVTSNSLSSLKSIGGQYVGVSLKKTATDTWTIYGNLIA